MNETAFPFFSSDWLKLQEKYWQAWRDMSRFPGAGNAPIPNTAQPWNQAMDQWWKTVSPSVSDPVRDFVGNLVDQGKQFFGLSESLFSGILEAAKGAGAGGDWQRLLEKSFADMKTAMGASTPDAQESLGKMLAFWELPMDTWQRTFSVMSGVPGDFMQPLKALASHQQAPVREQLNKFLSVPGVGYAREHQEQYQKLTQLFLDYQTAFELYTAEQVKINEASVDRFQAKVMASIQSEETIDSIQSLFNLWVDASEEAYAERVSSDEYARVYGRLVNSLMAFKKQSQALVDENLGLLSMPTREDITTLQERYQCMRRELREVHGRMDRLERERNTPRPAPRTSAPAPRKKAAGAPRKKATAKKTTAAASRVKSARRRTEP